ncbi:transposase [Chamaesiphon sp. GL140_3_metabinner_50]|uniref:transposase n=1 Tax=Chamaesiphon sp. GL140_3_metabinner_50 TaxID=2970812 RepID=UPI0025D5C7C9|nr:transposase [Chamaesiphon sp. GL140_3_metabinner_50]
MSSKKITDAEKLEIVDLYRQSGDTTAALANRYGVSNSTIGRILKSTIPEAEYESLIQQRRSSKASSDKEITLPIPATIASDTDTASPVSLPLPAIELAPSVASPSVSIAPPTIERDVAPPSETDSSSESNDAQSRRVRRRSSAPIGNEPLEIESLPAILADLPIVEIPDLETTAEPENINLANDFAPKTTISPPIPRTPVLREILADSHDRYANPPVAPVPEIINSIEENEEDREPEDVNALAAMFGEEVADNDEEEEEDNDVEDWAEEPDTSDRILTADGLHVRVKPLSQATLPRTCYIVIDKFAELIVRPLKDFADLGQISGEETQQRTLPVFDNPRVAKRFSNQRTQRVIKVPDSRVFYKTSQQLKSKGIACLLIGGNIYSLN